VLPARIQPGQQIEAGMLRPDPCLPSSSTDQDDRHEVAFQPGREAMIPTTPGCQPSREHQCWGRGKLGRGAARARSAGQHEPLGVTALVVGAVELGRDAAALPRRR
jgi:hypothetical protein